MAGLLAKTRKKKVTKNCKSCGTKEPPMLREKVMRERAYKRVLLFMGGVELV
jgi:hypothetical protein